MGFSVNAHFGDIAAVPRAQVDVAECGSIAEVGDAAANGTIVSAADKAEPFGAVRKDVGIFVVIYK